MEANGRKLGVLVVGVGSLGARRAAAAVAAKGTRLVAVVETARAAARAVAGRYGAVVAPDLGTALEFPGVELVIVATPHADHADQVRRSLEAGKHVLCEKPLTIDPDEARALARLADRGRLRLATGFNHRFYPPVREALELVDARAIGLVEHVRAEIGHMASAEFLESWHTDVARSGGGTLIDNGPHACDLIRRLLGEVALAEGRVRDTLGLPEGCESEAETHFRGRDRGDAELRSSWALASGYLTVDVRGSEGHLRIETAPWRLSGTLATGRRIERRYVGSRIAERVHRLRFGCERSLVRELEAFVGAIRGGPRVGATGWDGCRATEMVQAVYASARSGAEVALTPLPVTLPAARGRASERDAA
jgi:predicted dehydrogenase